MISADSIQSVFTINPKGGLSPLDHFGRRRMQNPLVFGRSSARLNTSVATSCFNSSHVTTTIVSSCDGGATDGRIHLAFIVERPAAGYGSRVVRMKYSSKVDGGNNPSFTTVCIANIASGKADPPMAAILFALDAEGNLYAHHIEKNESVEFDDNHLFFDMKLCFSDELLEDSRQKSPKRGRKDDAPKTSTRTRMYPFTSMNNLTPRLEALVVANSNSCASDEGSQESPCSTPKRKGRKRKATTPSRNDKRSRAVYAVVSSLNNSLLLSSQFPPVIIRLSPDDCVQDHKFHPTGVSLTQIPGLELHIPMTCITFASRALCGNILWNTIVSLIRSNECEDCADADIDEGIVLMGFQDGSLYGTIVTNGEPCKASKMLQLNGSEPFLSLEILRGQTLEPKLMCIGTLGTITIIDGSDKNDPIKVHMKRLPFHGRWCSFASVGYHKNLSDGSDITMIGTNDTGRAYLCQFSVKSHDSSNLELQNIFRIPITCGIVSSVDSNPTLNLRKQFQFVSSSSSGKISLMMMSSDWKVERGMQSKYSLLAMLRQKENSKCVLLSKRRARETTHEVVCQTLKAAISTKQERVDTRTSVASFLVQSNQAAKEARETIRMVSLSSRNAPPPIRCTITASKSAQGFDLKMENENMPASSSWYKSIHIINSSNGILSSMLRPKSIDDMTPICYRRTKVGLVKVLYGGSSTSLSCQNTSSIYVPAYDFGPVSLYASLSKIYIDHDDVIGNEGSNSWVQSVRFDKNIAVLDIRGQANFARMQGAVVPFKLGKQSSVPLAGDVFTPLLIFATIVMVKGVSDVRSIAEKEVEQLANASEKVHCCSSSILLASSKNIEEHRKHESRGNVAPIALVLNSQKDTEICEVGFALGSNDYEFMQLLPLMRHSIILQSQREEKIGLVVLKNECYRRLLSEKKAAKIAKHVDKCARELLSRSELSSSSDICPTALLTKCVSLYEIMRTLQFIFG